MKCMNSKSSIDFCFSTICCTPKVIKNLYRCISLWSNYAVIIMLSKEHPLGWDFDTAQVYIHGWLNMCIFGSWQNAQHRWLNMCISPDDWICVHSGMIEYVYSTSMFTYYHMCMWIHLAIQGCTHYLIQLLRTELNYIHICGWLILCTFEYIWKRANPVSK